MKGPGMGVGILTFGTTQEEGDGGDGKPTMLFH